MDELIERLAVKAALIMLSLKKLSNHAGFPSQRRSSDKVQALIDQISGAEAAIAHQATAAVSAG